MYTIYVHVATCLYVRERVRTYKHIYIIYIYVYNIMYIRERESYVALPIWPSDPIIYNIIIHVVPKVCVWVISHKKKTPLPINEIIIVHQCTDILYTSVTKYIGGIRCICARNLRLSIYVVYTYLYIYILIM